MSNDGRHVLALDIGGTNFRLALVDEDGSILRQNRGGSRAGDGPEAAIRTVLEAAGDVLAGAKPESLAGMGIAIAGLVTPKTGVLLTSPNLLSWYNTPVKDIFEREFRNPVSVGNDANMAVLGEHRFGAGAGSDDVIYITWSTGIGGGVVADGRIYHGAEVGAGEFGPIPTDHRGPGFPFAPVGRRIAGTEMGVLLGYLGQRVLGQYDLLVLDDKTSTRDAVYFVGPNILSLEKRFAFRPRDFRLWIAIHEVTHRAQFTAVPWMKPYFLSLVEQSLSLVEPDPQRMVRALRRAVEELRAGRNPLDSGGVVALIATPEQRGVLSQVQALMSMLEGHGNFVMNRLGADHVAGHERMARMLRVRRRQRGLGRQVQRLFGLELKMRQYDLGERFVTAVVDRAGTETLDSAWRGPEWLPTIAELEQPADWIERVGRASPASSGSR